MEQINGRIALKFILGIEAALVKAGGGRYRAFSLLEELATIGLTITAMEMPPEAPAEDRPAEFEV